MSTNTREENRPFLTELLMGGAVVMAMCSYASAAPQGGQVVRGNVSFSRDGDMTVIRASDRSIINFRSFDLSRNEIVQFIQPSSRSSVLNRITGDAPTLIDGSIIANGRVFFMNPAGVTFGPNSVINVGTLVAGAGTITDANFLRDNWQFNNLNGRLINQGTITADTIALLGHQVSNFGQINAANGTVVMAAGDDVLIGRRRDRIFAKIASAGQAVNENKVSVSNAGTINAPGGQVTMASADTFGATLFNAGTIRAQRASLNSGAKGRTVVTGTIDVSNDNGAGGQAEILGGTVELRGARVNADGATGGGDIKVGGGKQGFGTELTSQTTLVDRNSMLTADATVNGDGGSVVLWSDGATVFTGSISARGGNQGGAGGFVEVSGGDLGFYGDVNVSSPLSRGGQVLLDPRDLHVVSAVGATQVVDVDSFGDSPNTDLSIDAGKLTAILNGGGAVTLQANRDLFVETNITVVGVPGTGGDLSLFAQRTISFLNGVAVDLNGGDLLIEANRSAGTVASGLVRTANPGAGNIVLNPGVSLNSGTGTVTMRINPAPLGGPVYVPGTLKAAPGVAVTASNTILDGVFNGSTATDALRLHVSGGLTISANTLLTGSLIDFAAGDGDLAIGSAVSMTTPGDISLVTGSGATRAVTGLGLVTFPTTPSSLTVKQGANIGLANQASPFQFTANTLPATMTYQSLGGSVSVTNAFVVNGVTTLNLLGLSGVTINTGANTITVGSLLINGLPGSGGPVDIESALSLTGSRSQAFGSDPAARTFAFASTGSTFTLGAGGSITSTGNSNLIVEHTSDVMLGGNMTTGGSAFIALKGNTTQSGGILTAPGLLLQGGPHGLLQNNQIDTLAADTAGTFEFHNNKALTIGTVNGVSGLNDVGFDAFLQVNGLLTLNALVDVSGSGFTIDSLGAKQLSGIIKAAGFVVGGTGDFDVSLNNNVGRLLGDFTGNLNFRNAGGITIGSSSGSNGLFSNGGNILLQSDGAFDMDPGVDVDTRGPGSNGRLTINTAGGSQGNGARLITGNNGELLIVASGPGNFNFNNAGNNTGTFAASAQGRVNFRDTNALTVGSIAGGVGLGLLPTGADGITTGGRNVTLRSEGLMTLAQGIEATGARITLRSGNAVAQTGGVLDASDLLLQGTGDFELEKANKISQLAADIDGTLALTTINALTIGTVDGVDGIATNNHSARLIAGKPGVPSGQLITQTRNINLGSGRLAVAGSGYSQDAATSITASELYVYSLGAGNWNFAGSNNIGTVAAFTQGTFSLKNTSVSTLTVATLFDSVFGSVGGVYSSNNDVTIDAAGALALAQGIDAGGATVRLTAAGMSQSAGFIKAGSLLLKGTGAGFTLNQPNQVGTLAANVTGPLSFTNAAVLGIGTIDLVNGLFSNGNNITLSVGGALTQGAGTDISAGAGNIDITALGMTQGAGARVLGSGLALRGTSGDFVLKNAGNNVSTIATQVAGNLWYTNTSGLTVGTVNGLAGIDPVNVTLDVGGLLTISNDILASGIVTLRATGGVNQQGGTKIVADALALLGSGSFNVNRQNNDVNTFAANINGALDFRDTDDVTVGSLVTDLGNVSGVTTSNNNADIQTGGLLTIAQNMSVGNQRLRLNSAAGVNQTGGVVTADKLLLRGSGSFVLTGANLVNTLATDFSGTSSLDFNNAQSLIIGTIGANSGVTTSGDARIIAGGLLSINQAITSTGGNLFLGGGNNQGITQTAAGVLKGNGLALLGTGPITLTQGNTVSKLAGDFTGDLDYNNTTGFAIGTVGATAGLNSHGGNVQLTAPGKLTFDALAILDAGSGRVTLKTLGASQGLGSGIYAANLLLQNAAAADWTLDQANKIGTMAAAVNGQVSLTNLQDLSIGTVSGVSGIDSTGGAVTLIAYNANTATGYAITQLSGANINAGSARVTLAGKSYTQDVAAKIIAGELSIIALGDGDWSLIGANDVDSLAAFTRGKLTVNDIDGLAVTALAGGPFGTVNGILSSGHDIALTTGGLLELNAGVDAGTAVFMINSAGGVTQDATKSIIAHGLCLEGSGAFNLPGNNVLDILSADITGSLTINGSYSIGNLCGFGLNVSGDIFLTSSAATFNIGADITTAGRFTLKANGVTQSSGTSVKSHELVLIGMSGELMAIDSPTNDFDLVAAKLIGGLTLWDANQFTVASLGSTPLGTINGIDVDPAPITLVMPGSLTLAAPISNPGQRVTLWTGGATQNAGANIIAGELVLLTNGASTNPFTLTEATNNVTSISAYSLGEISYRDADGLAVTTALGSPLGDVGGILTVNKNVTLAAGGLLALQQGINVGTAVLSLNAAGAIQSAGILIAAGLEVAGPGSFDLQKQNQVGVVAANVQGDFLFTNDQDINVGQVGSTGGIYSDQGKIRLVAGNIATTTGHSINLLVNGLNANNGDIELIGSGLLQDPINTVIFGNNLAIVAIGTGDWLALGANDVDKIAAFTRGALVFTDVNDLTVGKIAVAPFGDVQGILSSNKDVVLAALGRIQLNQSIDAGTARIGLVAGDGIDQFNGILRADQLLFGGAGNFNLVGSNEVRKVAGALISGNVDFRNVGDLTINSVSTAIFGQVFTLPGLFTLSGNIALTTTGALKLDTTTNLAATGRINVTSLGMTQGAGSAIIGNELVLRGTGNADFILASALNDVNALAAQIKGELSYTDANILSVESLDGIDGINIDPAAVTLTMPGLLTLNAPIFAPGFRVTLNTGGVNQTAGQIIANELALITNPAAVGNPWFLLNQGANNVAILAADVNGLTSYRDADALTIGTITGTPAGTLNGVLTHNADFFVQSGGLLTLADNVDAGTGIASLATGSGVSQTAGIITADRLLLLGNGTFDLQKNNLVNTIAGLFNGELSFKNAKSLTVGSVLVFDGLTSTGNRINLDVNGSLTLNKNIDAGASIIDIIAQNGASQPTGLLIGGSLKLRGAGVFALGAQNQIGTIAADINGPLTFTNSTAFNVGTVDALAGIKTNGNNVLLTAGDPGAATGFVITQLPGADIIATGARVTLVGAGYSQSLPSAIKADELALIATADGEWSLGGGNDVNTFAGFTRGKLLFNDINTLKVGTILATPFGDVNGILSSNFDVTLKTGGLLTLVQSIVSGSANTFIESQGGVDQTNGIIKAAGLCLDGTGIFNLPSGNEVGTLAADITGSLLFNNAIALSIGQVGLCSGINLVGGDLTLCTMGLLSINADIIALGNRITLQAKGATQSVGTVIKSHELALISKGAGDWTLDQPNNNVDILAATVEGKLTYRDADGLALDKILLTPVGDLPGVTTNGNDLTITAKGLLDIKSGVPVLADNSRITFKTYGATQGAGSRITANELLLIGNGVNIVSGLGDFDLQSALNNINTIAGDTIGFIKYRNADSLVVGSIGSTDGLTTHEGDVYLRTDSGGIAINEQINAGFSALVRLQSFSAPITQNNFPDSAITAGRLLVRTDGPGGDVALNNPANQVLSVAAIVDGNFNLVSNSDLRVTTLPDPLLGGDVIGIDTVGLTPGAGNIALQVLNGGRLFLSQQLNAPGMSVRLQSDAGLIAQTDAPGDNAFIIAKNLFIKTGGPSAGAFLESPTNDVLNLAADMTGELKYRDASNLFITTVADWLGGAPISGINTHGFDITVRATDKLTLEANVLSSTLTSVKTTLISDTAGIEQTGGHVLAGKLVLRSKGSSLLTSATNDVDLLDALTDGGLNFVNSVPLGVKKAISVNSPIRIKNDGLVTIITEVNAGTSQFSLISSAGAKQNVGSKIIAKNLYVLGTGPGDFLLGNDATTNDVETLAAQTDGIFRFDDSNGMTVGQVNGIYDETGTFLSGIFTNNHDAYLRAGLLGNLGGINIIRPIDVGGSLLRLETLGGDITQGTTLPDSGPITAGKLLTLTLAPGNVILENVFNKLGILAGEVGGKYHVVSSTDLTVDTLVCPLDGTIYNGLHILGTEAFLTAPGLTVNKPLDASQGGIGDSLVRLTVDNLQINDIVRSGNSITSGIWVRPLTPGRNFRLGDEVGSAIRLTQAELLFMKSPLVQLGDEFSGSFTTTNLNLTAAMYDLVLRGKGITTNGLQMTQQRKLTLWAENDGVSAPGQVTAGFLVLKGKGAFILANSTNDFERVSADVVGPTIVPTADVVNVADANSLIVDIQNTRLLDGTGIVNVNGIKALAGDVRLTTGSGDTDRLTLWSGVADNVNTILSAPDGGVFLTTNNITINRLVEAACRIVIAPVTPSRPIVLGGAPGPEAPGTLTIDADELNRLISASGIALGGPAVSSITVPGFTYGGPYLELNAQAIRFTGGATLTAADALLYLNSPSIREQGASFIKSARLGFTSTGNVLLTSSGNDFDLIAGTAGNLRLSDDDGFEVGVVTVNGDCVNDPPKAILTGITATGSAALITRGLGSGSENNVFFNANVKVGDKLVLASQALGTTPLFYQAVGTKVDAPNLLLSGRMGATLDQAFNILPNVSGLVNGGVITLRTNGNMLVTNINDFTLSPSGADVDERFQNTPGGFNGLTNDGNINITSTGRLTLGSKLEGDQITVDSEGLGRTNGFMVANRFVFTGGGDIALGVADAADGVDGVNRVKRFALLPTRVMTEVDFANDGVTSLIVEAGGANIRDGRVYLRARDITFEGPFTIAAAPGSVDPESGAVRVTTDIITVNANLTGEGGILFRPLTSGTPITLGGSKVGGFSLSGAELARLLTGRTVQIGSATTGQINVSNAATLNYNLSLLGRGMTVGSDGLALTSGKTLFFNPFVTGVTQTTGRIAATNMLIKGTGPVILGNDANAISNAAIEVNGPITLHNDIDLTIKSLSADDLSARNRVVQTGGTFTSSNNKIIVNVTDNLTVGGDVNAGTSTVNLTVTDVLNVLAGKQIIGGAGITIDPSLLILGANAKMLSANGLIDITTDGAQWDPTALINGFKGVKITTETAGRTIRLGGSSIFDNAGELGLSDSELLVIGGVTPQVDINAKGAGHIIVSGDAGVANAKYIDLTTAPYNLVLRADQPGAGITFERGFRTNGKTLRFIGPSLVRNDIVLDTQSGNQDSVRFDGITTFGMAGSLDNPIIESNGTTLNFNGATVFNRTTTINTRVPGDAFANPNGGRLVFNGNLTGIGGLNLLTPLSQWAPTLDPITNLPVFSRLPQIAFNTDPSTHIGSIDIGYLRINALRDVNGVFVDGQPVRTGRPPIPTVVFNYNGFVTGDVGSYSITTDSDVSFGPREQMLSYGPMNIQAFGGMLLADVNVLGDVGTTNNNLTLGVGPGAGITVWTRPRVEDNPATTTFNELDIGASIVAQGNITLTGVNTFTALPEPGGAGNNNFIYVLRPDGTNFTQAVNSRVQRRIFFPGDNIDIRRVREGGLNVPPPLQPFELALGSFPFGFVQAIGTDELNLADALAAALAVRNDNDAVGPQGNLSDQQIQSLARLNVFVRRTGTLDLIPTRFGKIIIDASRNPVRTEDGAFLRSTNARDFNVSEPRLTEERVDRLLASFDSVFNADLSGADTVKGVISHAWGAYVAKGGSERFTGIGFRAFLEAGNDPQALEMLNKARDLYTQLDELGLSDTELVFPKRTIAGLLAPTPDLVGAIQDAIAAGAKDKLAAR